jgi:hypothetical protein
MLGMAAKKSTASSTSICSTSPMLFALPGNGQGFGVEAGTVAGFAQGTFTSGKKLMPMVRMPCPSQPGQRPSPVLKLKRPGP